MGSKIELPLFRDAQGNDVIIFIHGLSGSKETWLQMLKILTNCHELDHIGYDCYEYPTTLFRLPFGKKMATVQEISEGLKTFLTTKYKNRNILLVAHSLGGIIARNYILDSIKCNRTHYTSGLLLYASPLNGAGLANIASKFSWKHAHLQQLSIKADLLTKMNQDWVTMNVASLIEVRSIIGGSDAIVSRESANPYIGDLTTETIIGSGHIDITKPDSKTDLRFIILYNFISSWSTCIVEDNEALAVSNKFSPSDILFDTYNANVEKFYIQRREDQVITTAAKTSSIWLSGPPGVGKTAALKRLITQKNWEHHHIILDSFYGLTATDLIREICNILKEAAGVEQVLPKDITNFELVKEFRKTLSMLANGKVFVILIEEIPLPSGPEYNQFIDYCYSMTLVEECINNKCRVIWLFSSIKNPKAELRKCTTKLYEKIQFIEFERWRKIDLINLINIINNELQTGFNEEDIGLIVSSSEGSPRFVKMLFRHTRNEIGFDKSLSDLLDTVKREALYDI